jgi:dTDP-4-dehydrorhamnose reductase
VKVLLTGAAGQLGRSLQRALPPGSFVALGHADLDITEQDSVHAALDQHRPEIVINCAAYNAVDAAEGAPEEARRVNVSGPRNLARATAAAGTILMHVSTDYVFDGETTRPYNEFDQPNPLSVYGASKLEGEEAVRQENARHCIVRTSWVYHTSGRNFPNAMRALAARGTVRVASDVRGSPTYAPHLAAGLLELAGTGAFGTFHLAGSGGASRFELARLLFACLGLDAELIPASAAEFHEAARRPRFSELTTARVPRIVLPPWQEGVTAFARDLTESC